MEFIMTNYANKIEKISASISSSSNASSYCKESEIFVYRERGVTAYGRWDAQGQFLLLKGSVVARRSHTKTKELVDKL